MEQTRLIVISGGPGAGKTTLLEELRRHGYACSDEVARKIIQEQLHRGSDALPWGDREQYSRLMLERSVAAWREHAANGATVFFDRAVPDTLCYIRLAGLSAKLEWEVELACRRYRYWPRVFLAPPWKEIYETDSERRQDFDEAVKTYERMVWTYRECDYEVVPLPLGDVSMRADFILGQIAGG